MSTPFSADAGLIIVHAVLWGPVGSLGLVLALDTGATRTTIAHAPLVSLGYDPGSAVERAQVTMGSGIEYSPLVRIDKIDALGQSMAGLDVIAHTLPPTAGVDGLLGLDFCRRRHLSIDFAAGLISLD